MSVIGEGEPLAFQKAASGDVPICNAEMILDLNKQSMATDEHHLSFKEMRRGALALGIAALAISGVVAVNTIKQLHSKLSQP